MSKLSPFRDGWRHLRLIVVYNPNFLFILPGAVMLVVGTLISLLVLLDVPILGRDLQVHSLIFGCLLVLLGVQAIGLGLCARAYGVYFISNQDPLFLRLRSRFKLEHGLVLALLIALTGMVLFGYVVGTVGSRRIRRASRDGGGDPRRHSHRDRRTDLLHVVPALDSRPPVPRRRALELRRCPRYP